MKEWYRNYFLETLKGNSAEGYVRMSFLFILGVILTLFQAQLGYGGLPLLGLVFPVPIVIFQIYWMEVTMKEIMIRHSIEHADEISWLKKMVALGTYILWGAWFVLLFNYFIDWLGISLKELLIEKEMISELKWGSVLIAVILTPCLISFYRYERKWKRLIYHAEEKTGVQKIVKINSSFFVFPLAYYRLHRRIHRLLYSEKVG